VGKESETYTAHQVVQISEAARPRIFCVVWCSCLPCSFRR